MSKSCHPFLSICGLVFSLALLPLLRAEETRPAVPPPPPVAASAPVAEKTAEAAPAEDKAVENPEKKPDSELRDLGGDKDEPTDKPLKKRPGRRAHGVHATVDDAPVFGDQTVAIGSKQGAAVSIGGNTTVDGDISDAAVSVCGDTTVNGSVRDAAVSVFGTTTVNGKVGDAAVAVFGDVVLGPKAEVNGEVVAVLGKVVRAPGAQVHGAVQQVGHFGPLSDLGGIRQWIKSCLLLGRPLWIGEGLGWAWVVAGCCLIFYMLIALLFPRGVERCVETIETRPGGTVLAAFLSMLLAPLLMVLLCVIVIGIPVAILFAIALFFGAIFGKVAVHAWLGRRIAHVFGRTTPPAPVLAVFFGGLLIMLLYMIPFLGFLLYKLFGLLGLGMVVYRLVLSMQREKPVAAAVAPGGPAVAPPVLTTGEAPPSGGGIPTAGPAATPPPLMTATLPRAGFWIRLAAGFLDFFLIAIVSLMISRHEGAGFMFLGLATYHVVMWKLRGCTIGDIICGLKIVRIDARPIDWTIAVVRALSAFLSFFMAGLGFIWVAFDDEKQSWHDKIAGTTIVRVPKGTSLL